MQSHSGIHVNVFALYRHFSSRPDTVPVPFLQEGFSVSCQCIGQMSYSRVFNAPARTGNKILTHLQVFGQQLSDLQSCDSQAEFFQCTNCFPNCFRKRLDPTVSTYPLRRVMKLRFEESNSARLIFCHVSFLAADKHSPPEHQLRPV